MTAVSGDSPLTVPTNVTAALDLNGCAIDGSALDETMLEVDGDLTLTDSSPEGGGTVDGGSAVHVNDGGSFTMTGGSITGCTASLEGGGVFVDKGSSFTLAGGSISGNIVSGDPDNLALGYGLDGTVVSKGTVNVAAAPDAPIGVRFVLTDDSVTIPDAVVFTTGALPVGVTPAQCFTSEMSGYQVFADSDGRAMLARPVTVTWKDDNGGIIDTDTVAYGTVPAHDVPVKAATARYTYTFAGWNDGTATYAPGEALPAATENVTYTATFTERARPYAITYDLNGGTMDGAGYTVTANLPSVPYDVTWDSTLMERGDNDGFIAVLPEAPASDIPVRARFGIEGSGEANYKTYSGTVPANLFPEGGAVTLTCEDDESDTVRFTFATAPGGWTNPETYTVESADITLVAPTLSGYTFTGWTWEGQTEPVMEVTISHGSTGDLAYTANWAMKAHTAANWADLQAALAEGGYVTAGGNLAAADGDAALEVPEGRIAVLDLNGCTVDGFALNATHALEVFGRLTITDSSAKKAGRLTRAGGEYDDVVAVPAGGSLTLDGGEIAGSGTRCTVSVDPSDADAGKPGGTFTMSGGTVSGSGLDYAAVYANGAFILSGGAVTGGGTFGGVFAQTDTFIISGKPVIREDVYLDTGTVLTIGDALDPDTKLSVVTAAEPTSDSPVVITDGLAGKGSVANFLSAEAFGLETNDDGEAQLIPVYMIEAWAEGRGAIEPSTLRAKAGSPVILTVTPEAGHMTERVSVTYIDEDEREQTVALTRGTGADANKWRFTMPAHHVGAMAAFAECFGTPDFILPASTRSIGESAFEGVTGMTAVEIPEGCQSIGKWAFRGCTGLVKIRIPMSVTAIDGTAFDGCAGVQVYGAPSSAAEAFCATHENCDFVAEDAGA